MSGKALGVVKNWKGEVQELKRRKTKTKNDGKKRQILRRPRKSCAIPTVEIRILGRYGILSYHRRKGSETH